MYKKSKISNNEAVSVSKTTHENKNKDSKVLRELANDFLNSRRNANNLPLLITHFEETVEQKQSIAAILHTLEVLFTELLKRGDLKTPEDEESVENKYKIWLGERYEDMWKTLMTSLKTSQAKDALKTTMKLIVAEGKWPRRETELGFPKLRFDSMLEQFLLAKQINSMLIQHFREYCKYLDVVFYTWQFLLQTGDKQHFSQENYALNYLELLSVSSVTDDLQKQGLLLCDCVEPQKKYPYTKTRKCINRVWHKLVSWSDNMTEAVHKQMLIVLLERVLPHLDKPILLTDFLMDSLENGGAISLLALQGVFTLIQKHNITYPDVYDKLYSLFEPEIFSTKYKARLFFLADIFLSSTHLPESLVAGFVKRLARLSLAAPPQDIIIIIYFIGNLLLRHTGLKRLVRSDMPIEVAADPYVMAERKPENSKAIESSLWEIVLLQTHILPNVASAARLFMQQLPNTEWNLSAVLDVNENDIFDVEIKTNHKQFALNYERPNSLYLPKDDKVQQYWNLF